MFNASDSRSNGDTYSLTAESNTEPPVLQARSKAPHLHQLEPMFSYWSNRGSRVTLFDTDGDILIDIPQYARGALA